MEKLTIYCDGGCRNNQQENNVGGWGILMQYAGQEKEFYGGARNTTNNVMELNSCIKALENVYDKNVPIEIITDSQYVVQGMNLWIANWIKKSWRNANNKPVANKELWLQLNALRNQFADITFIHCAGHSDNAGNNRADKLANMAMDKLQ